MNRKRKREEAKELKTKEREAKEQKKKEREEAKERKKKEQGKRQMINAAKSTKRKTKKSGDSSLSTCTSTAD